MSNQQGWVRLHRQLLEWEWFDEPNVFRLFIYCLLKANHQDRNYKGQLIKRGTFVTSLELLSEETKISVQSVRTSLKRLESTGELTSQRTPKGTVIQVVKYEDYQDANTPTNKQLTNCQQTTNKQLTTNNNDKNDNNEKEEIIIPSYDDFKKHAFQKLNDKGIDNVLLYEFDIKAKYEQWVENEWKDGYNKPILNWKSTLTNQIKYDRIKPVIQNNQGRKISL